MAPPKASLPARVIAGDFLNINWNKVSWMAPYQNLYPFNNCGGHGGRIWSDFLLYGHFANRTGLIVFRNVILGMPIFVLGCCVFFNPDWYQFVKFIYESLGKTLPVWMEEEHTQAMIDASWSKPGILAKHYFAGAVSIPGTENFVPDM